MQSTENQETICYKGGLDDTDERSFIISADQQGGNRGCEGLLTCLDQAKSRDEVAKGDRDVVQVRVAVPHDRDRDAVRCITITTSDQTSTQQSLDVYL